MVYRNVFIFSEKFICFYLILFLYIEINKLNLNQEKDFYEYQ